MNKLIVFVLFCGISFMSGAQTLPSSAKEICPLLPGALLPDVSLTGTDGKAVPLTAVLNQQPAILIVYRGGWCPFCNVHLKELQEAEKDIIAAGYRIIAVSPDSPESLNASVQKEKLSYSLYSDSDGTLARALGIAYKAPDNYIKTIEKASAGSNPGILPVPAVFVVNKEGKIIFEFLHPDYKTRLKAAVLMAVLKNM